MDSVYEKALGRKLRRLREEKDLTQEALSTKLQLMGCDITRSALAKMEVGQRHIYADEIRLLRRILNVSYEDLLEL